MRLTRLLLLCIPFALYSQQFFTNHPEIDWQVLETENFTIYYSQETAYTAAMTTKIVEEIIGPIQRMYDFTPEKKYAIILKDVDDYSNGGAFFFNDKVEIWAQNLDYPMRGTSHWLYNVLAHELTHMINIQASIKTNTRVPYGFLQILDYETERRADVVRGFPNVVVSYPVSSVNMPVWFAEGSAQYQMDGARHDYWDSHRDMVLRDRFLYDEVLTFSQMGVFGKNSHGNESAYNQGYDFVHYLASTYGDSVLKNIVSANSEFANWIFNSAFTEAVGQSPDSVYAAWYDSRRKKYQSVAGSIGGAFAKGQAIERRGFANIHPDISADGRYIAWLSNLDNDYWSQNYLLEYDLETGEKEILLGRIASAPAYSPDGRYLVYSRNQWQMDTDSYYQDIFVYDRREKKEYQITRNMRARQVDWSVNNELVFMISQDGSGFLYRVAIDDATLEGDFSETFIGIHSGEISPSPTTASRRIAYRFATAPELLTSYTPGKQYYHPRWSPDGKEIVYAWSNGYGRSISRLNPQTGEEIEVLKRHYDDRDPVYQADGQRLLFSSDMSGIYNLYSCDLNGEAIKKHSDVVGGAFMPAASASGNAYALYDSLGYKMHYFSTLPEAENLDAASFASLRTPPVTRDEYVNTDSLLSTTEDYRYKFSGFQILPRIFIDYGTFKPGLFLANSDPLDKWLFFAGAAVNFNLERDLYLYVAYNGWRPTVFLEFFNLTQTLTDTARIERSDLGREVAIPQELNFNLIRAATGAEYTVGPVNAKAQLIYNKYDATIRNSEVRDLIEDITYEDFPLSYTYLKGPQVALSLSYDSRKLDRFTSIAPRGGRYLFFRYTREWNDFLDNFKTSAINIENYVPYHFNRFEFIWEEFIGMPWSQYQTLTLKLNTGAIDQPVDGFFNFFAGGLTGMRGYSYYSIGGRFMTILQASYKFPIWQDIDSEFANLHFDKLYMNVFADVGNAWNELDFPSTGSYKRDIGFELRLDLFSYYLFPTRVFFSAAYPLDQFTLFDDSRDLIIEYKRDTRFYFGILFDFDLRERFGGISWSQRPLSASGSSPSRP
jgi:hypothetical protein